MKKALYIFTSVLVLAIIAISIAKPNSNREIERNKPLKVTGNSVIFLRPSDETFTTLENEEGIYEVDSDFGFAISRTIDSLETNPKFKSIKSEVYTGRYLEIQDCKNGPKTIDRDSIYYGLIFSAPNKEIKIIPNVQALYYLDEIEEYFNINQLHYNQNLSLNKKNQ